MVISNLKAAPSHLGEAGPAEYVNRPAGLAAQEYHAQTTGNKKVVVILVNFPSAGSNTSADYVMGDSGDPIDDIANIDSMFRSGAKNFKNYFDEASYSQLNLDVTYAVYGGTRSSLAGVKSTQCFTVPGIMSWYGNDSPYTLETLIKDALNAAGTGINKTNYDYVLVIHAGNGNESTYPSYFGDIWSVSVGWSVAVKGFTTGVIIPARENGSLEPLGVICHEFGHQLGLPDLYAPDSNAAPPRVGAYGLMDRGNWNDNGATPPHFCSWSKAQMGWVSPADTGDVQNVAMKSYYNNQNNSVYKFALPGKADEYFLLSYRKNGGYDSAVTNNLGGGITWGPVLLHIDDSIGTIADNDVNSYYDENNNIRNHPRVAIVGDEAWNTAEVFTNPDSNAYDGEVSGITIFGFSPSGSDMLFSAAVAEFSTVARFIEQPVNFPNPVRESLTTISFKLSAPEDEKTIMIYTPAGDLVYKIYNEDISAVYAKDNEITYQAPWDLKNDAGESVASGIYVYLVEAGDVKKYGNLTILK